MCLGYRHQGRRNRQALSTAMFDCLCCEDLKTHFSGDHLISKSRFYSFRVILHTHFSTYDVDSDRFGHGVFPYTLLFCVVIQVV